MQSKKTLCRICEAQCGLIVDVETDAITGSERVAAIKPNKDHVVSEGYACIKGLKMGDFVHNPDRLKTPLKKVDGQFVAVSWEQALTEIGSKLKAIHAREGGAAIAAYMGNPIGFSFWPTTMMMGFLGAFGADKLFTPGTQDCANKFAGGERLYGGANEQTFPDIDHTQLLIAVGSNPVISKMSFINMPNPMERIEAIEQRGGKVYWVNPRFTESANRLGQHIPIRPETDVFFMLGFLNELIARDLVDHERVTSFMNGFDAVKAAAARWTPEKTEPVTRIPAARLREMVSEYSAAEGAAIYCSTGVNQTRFGLLTYWLQEVINAVSGNLDKRGGTLVGKGAFQSPPPPSDVKKSRIANVPYVNSTIPGGIMADEILTPGAGRVRAMINMSGNPLLTCGNSERLAEAFADLELFVCMDIVRNETAQYADYVLPGLHSLERADVPFYFFTVMGLMPRRFFHFTDAMIKPPKDARDEGLILRQMTRAAGRPLGGSRPLQWLSSIAATLGKIPVLGSITSLDRLFFGLLARQAGLGSLKKLRQQQNGVLLEPNQPGDYLGKRVKTSSGKVELAPLDLIARVNALDSYYAEEQAGSGALKLIQKRERYTHNTWAHNVEAFVKGERNTNYLYIHPDDAQTRHLNAGDMATVSANGRSIKVPVKLDGHMMPGTVSVPHGWGHQKADGLSVASKTVGVNVNIISPDGPDSIEPGSGMSQMNGIVVEVCAA